MADLTKVKDDELRGGLEQAHAQLRTGKPTEAVHSLVEVFLSMLAKHPELTGSTSPARGGRRVSTVARWPSLGANLVPGSIGEGAPRIEYRRERFAMSEAITYYEFTVDTAIANGL